MKTDTDEPRRIRWDPTINLGHILTFAGFIIAGFSAYSMMDKRVTVLEERTAVAVQQATVSRDEQREANKELRMELKELQRSVNDIVRALVPRAEQRPDRK